MTLYPIIMCGGAGTRLWPASRPSRPKQFIALAGNRSLFQDTVARVSALAEEGGTIVVIAGVSHRDAIETQLSEINIEAQILLEPEARDSAAAMAAAALWVQKSDPDGIIVFVSSDHYIPDEAAFRAAVTEAASAAVDGRIVTLGVKPHEPSSAYGYIKPEGSGLAAVASFHEKPQPEAAQAFIEAGYLWNSGNFIVSARTLIEELGLHAPAVLAAASEALAPGTSEKDRTPLILGDAFRSAPKISIDYAVMEPTRRASVLEVNFAWSDLGAWDAIAASGEGAVGIHIFEDSERVLARAPDGVLVAALGVSDLAIIVEDDAVLVCDLSRSQEVKRLVERMRTISPRHLDFHRPMPESLEAGAERFANWLRLRALPVWSTLGLGEDGGFSETLTLDGQTTPGNRRARVQTRQIFVYAQAGALGWKGPWKAVITAALGRLRTAYLRPDGASRALIGADWSPVDETAMLYDQAFVLFALSAARQSGIDDAGLEIDAAKLRDKLLSEALPNGAMREAGEHPFQSNAHMHLFEASLAWEALSDDPAWSVLADRIAGLAMDVFIDRDAGFLREFFSDAWTPADGEDGTLFEPGHQFEWAWLLARYSRLRGDARALTAARTLYANGRTGLGQRPPVALDAMNEDMTVRSPRARLWPQTEWLKSSLILAETSTDGERHLYLEDAATALRALWLYLTEDGLWRDKRFPDGAFLDEPAPASSFYHIIAAFDQLTRTFHALDLGDGRKLTLG
jgi:mannose-1-phosphate guanylyltransferase/mannose-6-phosphate isomerase